MISEYHRISWEYLTFELPWYEYYPLLASALDLDERKRYWQYVLAGGDPKKWKWSSSDKAGTIRDGAFWDKVRARVPAIRGDISLVAQSHWKKVIRKVAQMPDGSTRTTYEDESGKDITTKIESRIRSGEYMFMGSHRDKVNA